MAEDKIKRDQKRSIEENFNDSIMDKFKEKLKKG